jgi:hypothetical protein
MDVRTASRKGRRSLNRRAWLCACRRPWGQGTALFSTSLALDQLGEHARAITNAEAALKIYVEVEDPRAEKVRRQLAEWGA